MLKKLKEKGLVDYEKYGKITLTKTGQLAGMYILRKHRLWETFLAEKLDFTWDEVHEIAEQLEHIHSTKLVDRIDSFLGFIGNKFGDSCYNNTFFDDCHDNNIGNFFYNNITDDDFDGNVIGNQFYNNRITANFQYNRIGENFRNNYKCF